MVSFVQILFRFNLALAFLVGSVACGVKGKPLPPKTPREIGIGKPLYKGVDEEMKDSKKKEKKEEQK